MAMNTVRIAPLSTAVRKTYVNASSLGSNAVVTAESGRKIRVLAMVAVTTLANSIKLMSAATDITATFPLAANGGFTLPFNEHGWCETAAGEALNINLSVATATGVQIVYQVL